VLSTNHAIDGIRLRYNSYSNPNTSVSWAYLASFAQNAGRNCQAGSYYCAEATFESPGSDVSTTAGVTRTTFDFYNYYILFHEQGVLTRVTAADSTAGGFQQLEVPPSEICVTAMRIQGWSVNPQNCLMSVAHNIRGHGTTVFFDANTNPQIAQFSLPGGMTFHNALNPGNAPGYHRVADVQQNPQCATGVSGGLNVQVSGITDNGGGDNYFHVSACVLGSLDLSTYAYNNFS